MRRRPAPHRGAKWREQAQQFASGGRRIQPRRRSFPSEEDQPPERERFRRLPEQLARKGAAPTGPVGERLVGRLFPVERRYRDYIARTDGLNDEPTVRILERILFDYERIRADRAGFPALRPDLTLTDAGWPARIAALARAEADYVSSRAAARTTVAAT